MLSFWCLFLITFHITDIFKGQVNLLKQILYTLCCLLLILRVHWLQEECLRDASKISSAYADKPAARRVYRSVKIITQSTFTYIRYSFLLYNSNFVGKTRRFYDIRLQKMSWPWNRGKRSLNVIESGTIRYIMYGFLLVFFSNFVAKTRYEIFDFKMPWPWKPG